MLPFIIALPLAVKKGIKKNVIRRLLPALLIVLLLPSCSDKEYKATREIESNGVKITLMATAMKDFQAGVAGGGHAPVFIPYAGYEKSWAIAVAAEGYDTLIVEEHANESGEVSQKQVAGNLAQATVAFSPDKKHFLYSRGGANHLLAHFLDNGKGFTLRTPAGFDPANPDWNKIPDTKAIIAAEIKNNSDNYKLWEAVGTLPAENEIDLMALEKFDTVAQARYLIEKRCYDWKQRSSKWKELVAKKFFSILQKYENRYRRDPLVYYSIRSIIAKAGNEKMDSGFLDYLLRDIDNGIPREELKELFADEVRGSRLKKQVEDACAKLRKADNMDKNIMAYELAGITGNRAVKNSVALDIQFRMFENKIAGDFIRAVYDSLDTQVKKIALNTAEEAFLQKNSSDAKFFLEDHADCEKLKELAAKYKGKIAVRNECNSK